MFKKFLLCMAAMFAAGAAYAKVCFIADYLWRPDQCGGSYLPSVEDDSNQGDLQDPDGTTPSDSWVDPCGDEYQYANESKIRLKYGLVWSKCYNCTQCSDPRSANASKYKCVPKQTPDRGYKISSLTGQCTADVGDLLNPCPEGSSLLPSCGTGEKRVNLEGSSCKICACDNDNGYYDTVDECGSTGAEGWKFTTSNTCNKCVAKGCSDHGFINHTCAEGYTSVEQHVALGDVENYTCYSCE